MNAATDALDLSVLIATRSRADALERTLQSMAVAARFAPVTWELVVVDNGSTDRTPALLREWTQRLPLRIVDEPEPGQNRARNRALRDLRGKTTVLTDDDVVVAPGWLREWKEGVQRWPDDSIFAGRIAPRFPDDCPPWVSSERFPFRAQCFAEFRPRRPEGPYPRTPFGPNFAIRTELLQRHPFRADLGPAAGSYAMGGETELTLRLKAQGHRVIYLPGPCVEHVLESANLTLEKLCQRGFNAGRGDEYRRAMRGDWSRALLWWRAKLWVPAKMATYALTHRLSGALGAPAERCFAGLYRYHAARGRRHQLELMRLYPPESAT